MNYNRLTRFSLITLLFLFTLSVSVQAQTPTKSSKKPVSTPTPLVRPSTGINLSLSPVFLNLRIDPGSESSTDFKIRNNNNVSENLKLRLLRYESTGNGGELRLVEPDANDPFPKWLSFSDPTFSLAAGESKTIKVTVKPPKEAALGYYYAIVVNRNVEGETSGGAVLAGAPAVPILVDVKSPNAKRELQLVDVKTDKVFYEYLPVQFLITVKNTGNIHAVPFGDIFIDWGDQKSVGAIPVNEGRGNVLPQSERVFRASWEDGFAVVLPKKDESGHDLKDKNGKTVYTTKYDFTKAHKFRIGKYTAHLLMVYDNGERDVPVEATVSFWVIPWKILGIAIVVLYFAFLGIKNTVGSSVKKVKKSMHR